MHEKTGHENKGMASRFRLEVAFQLYSFQWFNLTKNFVEAPAGHFPALV
jgi:hypothetical protein